MAPLPLKVGVAALEQGSIDECDSSLLMIDQRFPKRMRLLTAADFERVFAMRASASDGTLVIYGAPNDLDHPRLGLTVSRKIGNAVRRNRWKRLLREAFRLTYHELPTLDLVCLPRPSAEPDLHNLHASFRSLTTRIARQLARGPRRDFENTPEKRQHS